MSKIEINDLSAKTIDLAQEECIDVIGGNIFEDITTGLGAAATIVSGVEALFSLF
ncbi:MAG: hypothetical protein AAF383_01565 [Cyanobacteria bacterium P01_A01_bin.83]